MDPMSHGEPNGEDEREPYCRQKRVNLGQVTECLTNA